MFGNIIIGNDVLGGIGSTQRDFSELATGIDTISIDKDLTLVESATAIDTLVLDNPYALETAVGSDSLSIDKLFSVSDAAVGTDTLDIFKQMAIAKARERTRLKPVCLIEIALQDSGPTLYFSDRNIDVAGQLYENFITDVSGLAEEIERATSQGLNPDINLSFWNRRFKGYNYLIEIGDTYPFEGAEIKIKEVCLNDNNVQSVEDIIFKGALDEPRDIDIMSFTCKVSSMVFLKDQQWKQSLITKITYPSADPDDLNKVENIIYGSCEQVRCHAIKAGAVDSLTADITAASPGNGGTLELSDASEFPTSGAFTIQCENEQILIASRSGNTLTLAASGARGYGGTTAVSHDKGIAVFEVLTEYVYRVAGRPVKAIGDVYVDGVRQTSGVTKYTGQSGNSHASYPGKAVVVFSAKPIVKKQVNLSTDKGGTVTVSNPTHAHQFNGFTQNQNSTNLPQLTLCSEMQGYQGDSINFNDLASTYQGNSVLVGFNVTSGVGGCIGAVPHNCYVDIGAIRVYERVNGNTTIYRSSPISFEHDLSGSNRNAVPVSIWMGYYNATQYTLQLTINSASRSVIYNDSSSSTAQNSLANDSITVSLSGNSSADVVVGASVNADVDGYQDDASGTYTGTANALIERPDHVIKHFIDVLYGFALTDIDSTGFSAAGALYASAISGGYKFAFCINEVITPSQFLYSLATQCRSNIRYDKGLWKLLYLPDTAPAAVKTISKAELAGEFQKFQFNHSKNIDIVNDLTAVFKKNYGQLKYDESEWLGTATATDSTSQGKYGVRARTFEFPAVRSQAMADHVLAFKKLLLKNPLLICEFPVFWEHFDLVRGDTFDIDNPLYDAKKFYIEKVSRADKGTLEITGIQWPV